MNQEVMTKQEAIREGIKEFILEARQYMCSTEFAPEPFSKPMNPDVLTEEIPNKIMSYLHSQGVVKKSKCPNCAWSQFGEEAVGMTPCYSCNSTGYIVESLIDTGG